MVSIISSLIALTSLILSFGVYIYNQDREKRKIIVEALAILYKWLSLRNEENFDNHSIFEAYISLKIMLLSSKDIYKFEKISEKFSGIVKNKISDFSNEYDKSKKIALMQKATNDELSKYIGSFIKEEKPIFRLLLLFLFVNSVNHLFNNKNFDSNELKDIQYYTTYQFNYFLDFYERNNSDGYRKLLDEAVMAIISDMKNPFFRLCKCNCKEWFGKHFGNKSK